MKYKRQDRTFYMTPPPKLKRTRKRGKKRGKGVRNLKKNRKRMGGGGSRTKQGVR